MKKLKISTFTEKEFQNSLQIKGGITSWKNLGDATWRGNDTRGPLPGGGTYFNYWTFGDPNNVTNGTDSHLEGGGDEVTGIDYIDV